MKKTVALMLMLVLALTLYLGNAAADDTGILGKPLPDFTVTDSEGKTFTLSEALKDHEAVVINIWATWCGPCEREFPLLNNLYEKYSDRVAFIALSVGTNDTLELIEEYRQAHGIAFPMGRDDDSGVHQLLGVTSIPDTLIVDRFGNVGFVRVSAFLSENDAERAVKAFLGDSYTETVSLTETPPDTSTAAFPVSAVRSLTAANQDVRNIILSADGLKDPVTIYVVPDDTAHLRMEIKANDDLTEMVFSYYVNNTQDIKVVSDLYDPEIGAFVYEAPMPSAADESHIAECVMMDLNLSITDPEALEIVLIPDEKYIDEVVAMLEAYGYGNARWESVKPVQEESLQAYVLHVVDQNGAPVPKVYVNFCTDTTCTMAAGDATGTITFNGAPGVYHVQLLKVPDGYSADSGFEFYTKDTYGEWVLHVWKK